MIYYWQAQDERIFLIYGYVKSERDDLEPSQIKLLAELMKDLNHG